MKQVFDKTPDDIINDMWAYCMATANLALPHTILTNLMVSDANSDDGEEAWDWIADIRTMSCDNPAVPPGGKFPNVVHFAHNFKVRAAKPAGLPSWWWPG